MGLFVDDYMSIDETSFQQVKLAEKLLATSELRCCDPCKWLVAILSSLEILGSQAR